MAKFVDVSNGNSYVNVDLVTHIEKYDRGREYWLYIRSADKVLNLAYPSQSLRDEIFNAIIGVRQC